MGKTKHIQWIADIDKSDTPLVGKWAANLGDLFQAGFPIPNAFVIPPREFFRFVKDNNLAQRIQHTLSTVDYSKPESLLQASSQIQNYIMHDRVSEEFTNEIFSGYKTLSGVFHNEPVAIRSFVTPEDFSKNLFPKQQTFLDISGESNVILKIKEAWASMFDATAISYRQERQLSHFTAGISIVIQRMVEAERSGVLFTIDPVTKDPSKIVIEAVIGLGEYLLQGRITPDQYEVSKEDILITKKSIAHQSLYLKKSRGKTKEHLVPKREGDEQKISDVFIIMLAHLGKKLEKYYYFPQEIEWVIEKENIFILQARTINTSGLSVQSNSTKIGEKILTAVPGSPGIVSGQVRIITSPKDFDKVKRGEILIISQLLANDAHSVKKARGIILEKGGKMSSGAVFARGHGIPAVVGAEGILKYVKNGQIITVNGTKGRIDAGGRKITPFTASPSPKTATKVFLSVDHPTHTQTVAHGPVDGVGLLHAESMIREIGIHPKKFIHDGKQTVFVHELAERIAVCLKTFHPQPVIYRTADLTTDEYRKLGGGKSLEPLEPNPRLGYRGAFRYLHDTEPFLLELEAIKLLRNKMNLRNISIMIPFVRTVNELIEIKKLIASVGLYRSPSFKIWVMVQIPSNVFFLDKFIATGIDGIAIDTDELAAFLLGIDNRNEEIAAPYDPINESVLSMYEKIIKIAQKHSIPTTICGTAPSLSASLVEHLVNWGITSITVPPEAVDATRETISLMERHLLMKNVFKMA